MSISAVSSNLVNDLSQQQNPIREIRQDFKQLASALQSGSLSSAQSAYSNIQGVLQASQGASGSSGSTGAGSSLLQSDFAALGQALQSGDLSQAQSAFAQLQSDGATRSGQSTPPAQDQYVPSPQTASLEQQARQDYQALASGLQSGNLTNAQAAFTALEQVVTQSEASSPSGANSTAAGTTGNGGDAIANDLSTLGQALSSGSLTEAQSAFSQLQNDVQTAAQAASAAAPQTLAPSSGTAVEGHHHHHHGGRESESASATAAATTDTSSSVSIYG
jgi:hypothetical protein